MVDEARLEALDSGLAPLTEGWFVVNARDAAWLTNDAFGARCVFEANRPSCAGVPISTFGRSLTLASPST